MLTIERSNGMGSASTLGVERKLQSASKAIEQRGIPVDNATDQTALYGSHLEAGPSGNSSFCVPASIFGMEVTMTPQQMDAYLEHISWEESGVVYNTHPDGCFFCGSDAHHSQDCPHRDDES